MTIKWLEAMLRALTLSATAACFLSLASVQGATLRQAVIAADAEQGSCLAPAPVASFTTSKRQAVLWFMAERVRRGDEIRVDWIDPKGSISLSTPYRDIPSASALCLATQMPIAGFEGAANPGSWSVRIYMDQRLAATRSFRITPDPNYGAFVVSSVQRRPVGSGMQLVIGGSGFVADSTVHLATYSRQGGWTYITAAEPLSISPTQIVAEHPPLSAGEYWVIIRTPDKILSRPIPFVVASASAYRLPFPGGQRWVVTQGPYGSFSHWGNSLHAWDIAPLEGRCVVAMRAGIVHTHDEGAVQDHSRRTFGNYITIDHGDGEYSHYAHLASGTFRVRDGDRVDQGQPLAIVGNSGYTLGEGGGYHIHVSVTHALPIASPSVPFEFEEVTDARFRGAVVSLNNSAWHDCSGGSPLAPAPVQVAVASVPAPVSVSLAQPAAKPKSFATPSTVTTSSTAETGSMPVMTPVYEHQPQFHGQVAVEQWWSDLIVVPRGASLLQATLQWSDADAGLDLHLVSPRGEHFGWYGNITGYSGSFTRPQEFRIPNPEPGTWRISVQGVRGGGSAIDFGVDTNARRYSTSASDASPAKVRSRGSARRTSYPGG